MRVLIVGATGVIGRDLIPALLERGDEIVALVRSLERAEALRLPGVELVEGDLLEIDEDTLTAHLEGCDAAAHLATALRAGSPGLGTTNTNVALRTSGTSKLLAAATRAGIRRYIQQSIAMDYSDVGEGWIDETTPLLRVDAGTPRLTETMETQVRDSEGLEWLILRGSVFVGPDTFQEGTVERLRAGTEVMPGDGSNWMSFVHAADYAAAVAAALTTEAHSETLNITAEPLRNREYLERLSAHLEVPAPAPDPAQPLPRSVRCSNAAALEVLGWRPQRSLFPA